MKGRETKIPSYIEAYNNFDVTKMMADFSDKIILENILNGEGTLTLQGFAAFNAQAEVAKTYFFESKQTIESFKQQAEKSEFEIVHFGVLAIDFSNGMKQGQEMKLKRKSIFEFKDDKIIRLTDIS